MTTLRDLDGSRWRGEAELWLDPLGNTASRSDCTIRVESDAVRTTWSYEGKPHEGVLSLRDGGADFRDTWHQPQPMPCTDVPGAWGLLTVAGTYDAGGGPEWGWRIALCLRSMGPQHLVLQMTNITPWGEEGRAVRMICAREHD